MSNEGLTNASERLFDTISIDMTWMQGLHSIVKITENA